MTCPTISRNILKAGFVTVQFCVFRAVLGIGLIWERLGFNNGNQNDTYSKDLRTKEGYQ